MLKLDVMDNECSWVIQYIETHDKQIKFIPANKHKVNAAKQSIQTFNNHFIAGLATVDKNFPIQLWDELFVKAELTLNAYMVCTTGTSV